MSAGGHVDTTFPSRASFMPNVCITARNSMHNHMSPDRLKQFDSNYLKPGLVRTQPASRRLGFQPMYKTWRRGINAREMMRSCVFDEDGESCPERRTARNGRPEPLLVWHAAVRVTRVAGTRLVRPCHGRLGQLSATRPPRPPAPTATSVTAGTACQPGTSQEWQ
jgi:hypothetical protein